MLTPEMTKALNEQIKMEGEASQKYLAMAIWCDRQGLEGCANFMFEHADEERMHMMKLVHYVLEADRDVSVPTLAAPTLNYTDVRELFEAAYKNEQMVSQSIYEIVDLAQKQKDHQTYTFMQWYVKEQLEEEVLFRNLLDKFNLIGDGPQSLYFIDNEVASTPHGGGEE